MHRAAQHNGLMEVPTCYNRFIRWRKAGVWDRLLAADSSGFNGELVMIDSHLHARHQHGAAGKKGLGDHGMGRSRGGLTTKLHAICDGQGKPLVMLLSEGHMSDYKGAPLMLDTLPRLNPAWRSGL